MLTSLREPFVVNNAYKAYDGIIMTEAKAIVQPIACPHKGYSYTLLYLRGL